MLYATPFSCMKQRHAAALSSPSASSPLLHQAVAPARGVTVHPCARHPNAETIRMSTELKLAEIGLDESGKSTLTLPELMHHMASAKTVALLDSPFINVISESARLTIRSDGTYLTLPNRNSSPQATLSATIALLDAITNSVINPGKDSALALTRAEEALDETSLRCVQIAISRACRSEALEIQVEVAGKSMTIRLPHKSVLTSTQKSRTAEAGEEGEKIRNMRRYIQAISSSGMAALIAKRKAMPIIKAGDRIVLKMARHAKRFLKLRDLALSDRN